MVEQGELVLPAGVILRGATEGEASVARAQRVVLALPAPPTDEDIEEQQVQHEVEEMLGEQGERLMICLFSI
jgi:hypothetical protein